MPGKKCGDVMTKDVVCCVAGDTVQKVAQCMKAENVGALPVVDNHEKKKLVGIVTDRDLTLKVIAAGLDPGTTTLDNVMSRKMVVCRVDDNWQVALDAMAKHKVRRIPVVDEKGAIAGIIAQADVATRIENAAATAKVVEEISKAA